MRGISPIVAIVLMISIAVIGSVSVYFFTAGIATSQPTTSNPTVITANVLSEATGNIAIANLGSEQLVISYLSSSDGIYCNFSGTVTIEPGSQAVCTMPPKIGSTTLYGPAIGSVTIQMTDVEETTFQTNVSFSETTSTITSFSGGTFSSTQEGSVKLAGSTPTFTSNWSVWGYDTNNSRRTTETGPDIANLLWSYTATGAVSSSPAVVDGVVYFGDSLGKFFALNASDGGSQLWNYTADGEASSSAVILNGVAYFGTCGTYFYAINTSTADLTDEERQLWNYTESSCVWSSPVIANGKVYFGLANGNVTALDASTGDWIWNYTTGTTIYGSPLVKDGYLYIASYDDNFYKLDAATRDVNWTAAGIGGLGSMSTPVILDGVIYVGSDDNRLYAINATNGDHLWQYLTVGDIYSMPAIGSNGHIYISTMGTVAPACPFLYTNNGSEFNLQVDLFPMANQPEKQYVDYDKIKGLAEINGSYVIKITEEVEPPETSFIDHLRLWVVDHSADVETYPDVNGNIYTIRDAIPVTDCVDNQNNDCTELINAPDSEIWPEHGTNTGAYWSGDDGDWIEFGVPGDGAGKLLLRSADIKTLMIEDPMVFYKATIHVLFGYDNYWSEVETIQAGLGWQELVVPFDETPDRVRLYLTNYPYEIDYVGVDYSANEIDALTELVPLEAINSEYGDHLEEIADSDLVYSQINHEEELVVRFDALPEATEARSFIIESSGYYLESEVPEHYTVYAINTTTHIPDWYYNVQSSSSPAVDANGVIYFGDESTNINAVYPNGTLKWTYDTLTTFWSSPAIVGGVLYIGGQDNKLYAMGGYIKTGYYESETVDSGSVYTNWTDFTWNADTPVSTAITMYSVVYNTTQGAWVERSKGDTIGIGRYMKHYAELTNTDPYVTPELTSVSVSYYYLQAPLTYTVNSETDLSWVGLSQICGGVEDSDYRNETASGRFYSNTALVDANCTYTIHGPGITNSTYP